MVDQTHFAYKMVDRMDQIILISLTQALTFGRPKDKMVHRLTQDEREKKNASGPEIII